MSELIEYKKFSDFYSDFQRNSDKFKCPICDNQILVKVFSGFNMDKSGTALITCSKLDCDFNKERFVIEANPKGL